MAQPSDDHRGHADPLAASTHAESGGSTWKRAGELAACTPLAGRYEHFEILRREDGTAWSLGSGAMGSTFKAVDTRLHSVVALKVIRPEFLGGSAIGVRRFLREARLAASVHHPNVARVFHLGELADGLCFYAMEFVEGETLAERVRRAGPLPVLAALEITLQVTRALAAAARLDLIHRDIKPANLMLTTAGAAACDAPTHLRSAGAGDSDSSDHPALVKVIDFGLARSVKPTGGESLTAGGDFVGTPAFASPEQVSEDDEPIDSRSDIFSLGATLWFLLTGQQPFAGRTFEETQRLLLRARPVKQLRAAAVPEPLVSLLRTMLAVDPDQRPQTPLALSEMLVRCRRDLLTLADDTDGSNAFGRPCPKTSHRDRRRHSFVRFSWLLISLLILVSAWWVARRESASSGPKIGDGHPLVALPVSGRSIAVLPFANLSLDKDNAFFTDGVQDEVLTNLAKIADLKVISRTSVMQYKTGTARNLREIGQALGVSHVVEGSVQRVGNTVRVTAQLIDARTDAHLWAEHYDRPLDDVFAIQSDIAQKIAAQLQAAISPREHTAIEETPTHDLKAYELYLRARDKWSNYDDPDDDSTIYKKTLGWLTEATARDPGFARAYAFMTLVQALVYRDYQGTPEQDAVVRQLAETVERLRPASGDAHMAKGLYAYYVARDLPRAHDEFSDAVRLLPNDAPALQFLGLVERRQGRWESALGRVSKAAELNPEDADIVSKHEQILQSLRRYPEAIAVLNRWLTKHPQEFWARQVKADILLAWKADPRSSRAELALLPAGGDAKGTRTASLLDCDNCERDFASADRDLAACPRTSLIRNGYTANALALPRAFFEGCNARYRGDAPASVVAFGAARPAVEEKVRSRPKDASPLLFLATIDAALGNRQEALAEARRGSAMLTPEMDAADGPPLALLFARVLAWTGDRDEAIRLLQTLSARPNGPNYGYLHLHPDWDALRDEPRFETLIAKLAPEASDREK